jgi:hypothetical protein
MRLPGEWVLEMRTENELEIPLNFSNTLVKRALQ